MPYPEYGILINEPAAGNTIAGNYVGTDVSGAFGWDGTIHGPNVTVTATDGKGNTSEFSAPWAVECYRVFLPVVRKGY